MFFFFFFFQAEDGIRDRDVTGVQTCALPICMWRAMRQIPEQAWADAEEMRGAQVAETELAPRGWGHQQLRLIVRRVSVTAKEIRRGSSRARRRSTIPADQLQMVLD